MVFAWINIKFFFIGFLFRLDLVQNVASQSTKTYTQSNSATWEGRSALKEFWPLNLENKNQDDQVLLLKLLKLLTKENAAYKRIENSDILKAVANLDFRITEAPNKTSSVMTLNIVLNTDQNPKGGNGAADESKTTPTNDQIAANRGFQASQFDEAVLERHNMYRKKHKAPPLTYSQQISAVSQDWANQLAQRDEFKHRPNNRYGENLYIFWTSNPNYQLSPNAAVDSWYNEVKDYSYSKSQYTWKTGHFTQLVWKNSKQLGIGVAKSKSNKFYVVCNYSPPGNVIGQFQQNVLKP